MTATEKLKVPPNSQEAEMMVLGSMLSNINSLNIAADELDAEDFYYSEHKIVFAALKNAYRNNKPADVHLIAEELKRTDKLENVGGIAFLTNLAQYAGTSAYIEQYTEVVRNKAISRRVILAAQEAEKKALEDPADATGLAEEFEQKLSIITKFSSSQVPLVEMDQRLAELEKMLETTRGQKYLGLCQKTLPILDDMLLGLRKLIILAAPPNIGKTALALQLGLDVLINEPSACMIFFSLEMTNEEMLTRAMLAQSGLDFKTFVFGSGKNDRDKDPQAYFTEDESNKIQKTKATLAGFGKRFQIIDSATCPNLTARQAISAIENLKEETNCSRVIVIIDYLQVWPLTENIKIPSELEVDKWRIGQIKKIRDAINGDPVIVISEARKPSQNGSWGSELSDIMGSARGSYTPDVAILYTPIEDKDLVRQWVKEHKLPAPKKDDSEGEKTWPDRIKDHLRKQGIGIYKVDIAKGRDGMEKGYFYIAFYYRKNSFKVLDWGEIKKLQAQQSLPEGW